MRNLTKIKAGKYQHSSGVIIEKRGKRHIGRNGWANPGWAIIRDGREVNRFATLARAAEEVA